MTNTAADITKTTTDTDACSTTVYAGPTGLRAIVRRDHATFRVSVETMRAGRTVGMDCFRNARKAAEFAVAFVAGQH